MRDMNPETPEWQSALHTLKFLLSLKKTLCLTKEFLCHLHEPIDICILVEALKDNISIKELDFSKVDRDRESYINEDNVAILIHYLASNTTVTYLNLRNNSLCELGAIQLSNALPNFLGPLDTLILSNTSITDVAFVKLTKALRLKPIKHLDCSDNVGITDKGFEMAYPMVGNNDMPPALLLNNTHVSLKNLEFRQSLSPLDFFLSEKTQFCLAQDIAGLPLITFPMLIEALSKNTSITKLDLSKHTETLSLTQEDIELLSRYLSTNKTLTYLSLEGQALTDQGGAKLVSALKYNMDKKLHTLMLSNTGAGQKTAQALGENLARNPDCFKHLDLSCNEKITTLEIQTILNAICGMLPLKKQYLSPSLLNLKNTPDFEKLINTLTYLYSNFEKRKKKNTDKYAQYRVREYYSGVSAGFDILDLKHDKEEERCTAESSCLRGKNLFVPASTSITSIEQAKNLSLSPSQAALCFPTVTLLEPKRQQSLPLKFNMQALRRRMSI